MCKFCYQVKDEKEFKTCERRRRKKDGSIYKKIWKDSMCEPCRKLYNRQYQMSYRELFAGDRFSDVMNSIKQHVDNDGKVAMTDVFDVLSDFLRSEANV